MFTNRNGRRLIGLCSITTALAGFSVGLIGCDRTETKSKTTTTKTEETPQGTKTTTETHEKKVDVDKK
jgi:hypothetical protein